MWARLPFSRFSNRYSRGSSWFGIDDEEMRQVADRVGPHRLVDLARVGHLSAPLQPVRTEQDLQGLFRRVVVVPVLLHPLDSLNHAGGGFHGLRGLDRLIERLH